MNKKRRVIASIEDSTSRGYDEIGTNRTTKNWKTEMEKKTTVWIFQAITWRNLRGEIANISMKSKSFERN